MRIPWRTDAGPSQCQFYVFSERPRCLVTRLALQSPSPDLSDDEMAELIGGDCGGVWHDCPYEAIIAGIIAEDTGVFYSPDVTHAEIVEEVPDVEEVPNVPWSFREPEPEEDEPPTPKPPVEVEFVDVRPDADGVFCDVAVVATDEFLAGRSIDFSTASEARIRDEVLTLVRPISIGQVVATSGGGSGHPMLIHCVTHGLGSPPSSMEVAYAAASVALKMADTRGCRSAVILNVFAGFSPEERKFLWREFATRCLAEEWSSLELIILYPGETN